MALWYSECSGRASYVAIFLVRSKERSGREEGGFHLLNSAMFEFANREKIYTHLNEQFIFFLVTICNNHNIQHIKHLCFYFAGGIAQNKKQHIRCISSYYPPTKSEGYSFDVVRPCLRPSIPSVRPSTLFVCPEPYLSTYWSNLIHSWYK